jgi:hypothetical protein
MFLEDCDNFKDYFQTIFEMYATADFTKDEAIERLKTEYAFEQGKVKENYQKMYPDNRHLDYKFDEFIDFLEKYGFAENSDFISYKLGWDRWEKDFFHHCLKNQTNNTISDEILRIEISEEMLAVWKLLYLDSAETKTIPDVYRSLLNTSSSKNEQQHTDETVQTPEQAQQDGVMG